MNKSQWKILQDLVNVSVIRGKQFPESAGSFEELKCNTTDQSLQSRCEEPGLHLRPAGSSNILAPFLFRAQRKLARSVRDGGGVRGGVGRAKECNWVTFTVQWELQKGQIANRALRQTAPAVATYVRRYHISLGLGINEYKHFSSSSSSNNNTSCL
jgi:hypothetical protein